MFVTTEKCEATLGLKKGYSDLMKAYYDKLALDPGQYAEVLYSAEKLVMYLRAEQGGGDLEEPVSLQMLTQPL